MYWDDTAHPGITFVNSATKDCTAKKFFKGTQSGST